MTSPFNWQGQPSIFSQDKSFTPTKQGKVRSAVAAALPRFVMDSFQPGPKVVLAGCGEDSVPVGALALAGSLLESTRSRP